MPDVVLKMEGLPKVIAALNEWLAFAGQQGEVGWLEGTPPAVLERAYGMEYGLAARPGYETWAILRQVRMYAEEALLVDVEMLYQAGQRGAELMAALAELYETRLVEALHSVVSPELSAYTVALKKWKKGKGLSDPGYPPEKIWVDTAETLNAISSRTVPVAISGVP